MTVKISEAERQRVRKRPSVTPLLPDPRYVGPLKAVEVADIKALSAGTATADQQRRGIETILIKLSAIKENSFRPGESDSSAFIEGRRFVGQQIAALITADIKQYKQEEGETP